MANELKPCICGKTPRLDIKKGLAGITKVPFYREQIMCCCGVSSKIFKAPRKAVEAWNTRHGTLTNEGTTIPTPVAPVSPDATGKCEELVTVGYAPSEYDMGLDYQQLGISRLYPKSCASGAVAVVTRSQAEELLAAERAKYRDAMEKLVESQRETLVWQQRAIDLKADNAAQAARIKELEASRNEMDNIAYAAGFYQAECNLPEHKNAQEALKEYRDLKALEAKLAAAEKALEPFAAHANDRAVDDTGWRDKETVKIVVSIGDLRKARAALGGKPS